MPNLHRISISARFLTRIVAVVIAMVSVAFAQNETTFQANATTSSTLIAEYLYASAASADGSSGVIAGFRIGSDGELTSTGSPTPIASEAAILAPSRLGAKLFGIGDHRIWSFGVSPATGRLKFLAVVRFPLNVHGIALAVNPQSTLLFAGKLIDPSTPDRVERITTYRISSSGALTPIASKAVDLAQGGITVDPAGRFLYAHTEGADFNINISQFQINQTTGALTFIRALSLGEEDANNFVWSPGGAFLYQGAGTPKVKVFAKSSISGALQQIQEMGCNCANGPDGAGNVAIDGQGKFLFQATVSESGVAVYSRNSTTGLLSPLGSAFLSVSGSTPALAADASGRFLEVVDDTGTTSFAVGDGGTLTRAAGPTATPASGLVVLAVRF